MENYSRKIAGFLDWDYEIVGVEGEGEATPIYRTMLERGKKESFIPLLIAPNEVMAREEEAAKYRPMAEILAARADFLAAVDAVDVDALLEEWGAALSDDEGASLESMMEGLKIFSPEQRKAMGIPDDEEKLRQFVKKMWGASASGDGFAMPFMGWSGPGLRGLTDTAFEEREGGADIAKSAMPPELLFAKIPAEQPWEIPLWLNVFHRDAKETGALFKRWYEKYGAYPACISYDAWQLYAENLPKDRAEVLALCREMYLFNAEQAREEFGLAAIQNMSDDDVARVAQGHYWYFWWD